MQQELDKIGKEIESISQVLSRTPDDDPNLRHFLACLGNAHGKRYDLLEEPDDIQKRIEYTTIVLTLTPDDDPGLQSLLSTLGAAHGKHFQRLGEIDDIEKAVEYTSLAVALTPEGHPDLPRQQVNLALCHKNRYQRLGELGDIEKAIEYVSRALSVTPDDDPNFSEWLDKLGISHFHRFRHLDELNDLEQAIEYQSRGLASAPDGHPQLYSILTNLGESYCSRFQRLGELDDLEKATEYQSRALALVPDGHPDVSLLLGNLGISHRYRFKRLGEPYDLEKAIEYQSRAVALTSDGHPLLPTMLTNLGIAYSNLARRLGKLDDLEKAMQYRSRALALTPDGHRDLPRRLGSLGISHFHRFERLGELDDIEKAMQYWLRALALTPDGHTDLPTSLANLGAIHSCRFRHLGELADLEKAIECQSCALELAAHDNPVLCSMQFNLALFYVMYYEHTADPAHLQDSLNAFRIACKSPSGAPRDRFDHAYFWAHHASKYSALNCIEACQATIDLLPQAIWLGATTSQRYEDLKTVGTLAVDTATAAILSSNYPLALEWLEHARCVVWNQNLMLHTPLDQLQTSHPILATRLQSVAHQLHSASSESRESQAASSSTLTLEQIGQDHRRLAKEYDELLTHTRTLTGFEDFLQPIKANRLVHAAQNGPIVIINCHKDCCDALLILPDQGGIKHLPLPNFDGEKARRVRHELEISVRGQRLREREAKRRPLVEEAQTDEFENVLAVLWTDVVKPILDFLGYTNNAPVGNLPHITWCPTGAITFLPLHAAGDYDRPRSRVFDYVISSYTPTLTALLESTPHALSRDSRVLAIGQTATPGHSRLPGTAMELERVKAHTQDKAEYSQLINDQATTTAVLDAMEQHDWVHLACHAHQNVGNATESGFFLHDGVLDLASINRRSLKNKGLAFLSACQTATGDENLPDEAVHLASGMLMAGYTSVIATMWSVVDSDAPIVADKVYSELMKDGKLGNGEAGKALHNAVAGLRERVGEKEFGRWVPFIHIGS